MTSSRSRVTAASDAPVQVEVTRMPPIAFPRPPAALQSRGGLEQAVTASGGRCGYAATTAAVTLVMERVKPTAQLVAVLANPAGSTVDAFLDRVTLCATAAGEWERVHGAEIALTGPARPSVNLGGAATVSTVGLYMPDVVSATGGVAASSLAYPAADTRTDSLSGRLVVRPGQCLLWTFRAVFGANARATVELAWWERTAVS